MICEECGGQFEKPKKGPRKRFCSSGCRSRAWRRGDRAAPTEPGRNRLALEETLRVQPPPASTAAHIEAARSLADAVDGDPKNSPLWGRYLDALERLADLTVAEEEAEIDAELDKLRALGPRM